MYQSKSMKFLVALLGILNLTACIHNARPTLPQKEGLLQINTRESSLVLVPQIMRMPAHLLFTQQDRYHFFNQQSIAPFKKEMTINPLMHDVKLKALVMRGNKVQREYEATKSIQTVLSDNKTTWTAGRAKLTLVVPFIAANEDIVVETSYAWMDPRWSWPVYMEAQEPTLSSSLSVDVPFGVVMHYKAARNQEPFELIPSSQTHENVHWGQKDNRNGMGTRYIFENNAQGEALSKNESERVQVFFSFDLPTQNERSPLFNNWEVVSSYLYDRIDRYDLPSNAIRDFAAKETSNKENELAKITRILSFLDNDVAKRSVLGSFLEQEVQPATRTFFRRFGSPYDKAILGKAMLNSIGIKSDLLAVATSDQNPQIDDFFSPTLFHKVVLLIRSQERNFYWDPSESNQRLDQIPLSLQGRGASVIRKEKGYFFRLPFASSEENESNLAYDLTLSPEGHLNGSFSHNFSGLKADSIRAFLKQQASASTLSAPELQKQLNAGDDIMRWQTAALTDEKEFNDITISGDLTPRLVPQNGENLSLALNDLFHPVFTPLLDAPKQNFSSYNRIQANIKIPENYAIDALPPDQFIEGHGVSGRFSIKLNEGVLELNGESIVSLPLSRDFRQKMAEQLKKLLSLKDQKLDISPVVAQAQE